MTGQEPTVWAAEVDGRVEILTPDAMEEAITADRGALVGRTASTVVLVHAGTEVVWHRVREARYV